MLPTTERSTQNPAQNNSPSGYGDTSTIDAESAIGRERTGPVASAPVDERAKALSRLYDEVKAQVKTLVDDADPEGLLGTGSPPDEYDDAVAELTRHVLKDDPVDQGAIERWFGRVYGAAPARADALVAGLERLRLEAQNRRP